MNRFKVSYVKLFIATVLLSVSAVLSGVIATGLASGEVALNGLISLLGFYLNHFILSSFILVAIHS
ncbi:hypothetical protein [Aliivibrio fischeri]|uniref:hypothetical protein n=1 Tax=Aliivibrio fischeri TaxID=668 RepID=UPI0011BE5A19|nr:hypothetical protein [Aliivibrio fischeri]